jgi:hypothetical protein
MPIIAIPTADAPFYTQKTLLDGRDFILSFQYNQREDRIYLSIYDDESVLLIGGLKVLANYPLLFRHHYNTALPPGELIAIATTGDGSPPGLGELGEGKRCQLVYFDAAWIAANGASTPVVTIPIYVAVRVTPLGGYPGDAAFASALVTACSGLSTPGARFTASDILGVASGIAGATVTGLSIGTSTQAPGPVTIVAKTISLSLSQRPSFSVNVVSA